MDNLPFIHVDQTTGTTPAVTVHVATEHDGDADHDEQGDSAIVCVPPVHVHGRKCDHSHPDNLPSEVARITYADLSDGVKVGHLLNPADANDSWGARAATIAREMRNSDGQCNVADLPLQPPDAQWLVDYAEHTHPVAINCVIDGNIADMDIGAPLTLHIPGSVLEQLLRVEGTPEGHRHNYFLLRVEVGDVSSFCLPSVPMRVDLEVCAPKPSEGARSHLVFPTVDASVQFENDMAKPAQWRTLGKNNRHAIVHTNPLLNVPKHTGACIVLGKPNAKPVLLHQVRTSLTVHDMECVRAYHNGLQHYCTPCLDADEKLDGVRLPAPWHNERNAIELDNLLTYEYLLHRHEIIRTETIDPSEFNEEERCLSLSNDVWAAMCDLFIANHNGADLLLDPQAGAKLRLTPMDTRKWQTMLNDYKTVDPTGGYSINVELKLWVTIV